jgi:beta-lactamase superfamily II metal-dependent hydrolase
MRIHAINAFEGDSLLLEARGNDPKYALIDGGPRGTYEAHLRGYLNDRVGAGGSLEAVIVSHVDIDHIAGVMDLLADLERAGADGEDPPFKVTDLWHNSFAATIDDDQGSLSAGIREMATMAGRAQTALASTSIALLGIREGALLRRLALKLGIGLNAAFEGKLVAPDELIDPRWNLADVSVQVVGPTDANLRALRAEWRQWIEDHLDAFAEGDLQAMANADQSIPNLSSIILLASDADGSALLTGDARGDHILQGLVAANLLDGEGKLHVHVLKLQHHGSDRNVTKDFFRTVTADLYLVSADGKNGNPDFNTLKWLVDVAHEQGRRPVIVATNRTQSTDRLLAERPPAEFGYRLEVRPETADAIVVDVAAADIV